jgi:hypothetical protein
MADVPLALAIPAATLLTGAIGTLFGLLIRAKSSEAKAWKGAYKDAVADRRRIRREVERAEMGAPSVPPPPDEEYDDRTGRIQVIDQEDHGWGPAERHRIEPGLPERPPLAAFEDRLTREERQRNEVDRKLRKFISDGESTPPKPIPPLPAYRGKLPSRRG